MKENNVKYVSFKLGPEDCYGRCGSDMIWQTVPDTCSGECDRESSVTVSKESFNKKAVHAAARKPRDVAAMKHGMETGK